MCDTYVGVVEVLRVVAVLRVVTGFDYSVAELTATFVNSSTNASSYVWDFGDGVTTTETNPVHTYAAAGDYRVTLYVTGACGTDVIERMVTVGLEPVVEFTSNSPICLNDTALFTSMLLTGTLPVNYLWNLGDGVTSTLSSLTHTYAMAGGYPIELLASNDFGTDWVTGTIQVLPLAVASFDHAALYLDVVFTNTSQYANSYLWDFGDGIGASIETHPSYTYAAAGTYTVTLEATGDCGVDVYAIAIAVDAIPSYQLTVNVDPANGGSVELDPAGGLYEKGMQVTPTTPTTGWTFAGWSGALSGTTNPATITMDSDKVVTAAFERLTYTLDVTIVGSGAVAVDPLGPYYYGDVVTLTATLEAGWQFDGWSNAITATAASVTVTMDADYAEGSSPLSPTDK